MLGAYSVSKTAMLGLTKALTYELSPLNIRINGLAPGIIKTRMSEAVSLLILTSRYISTTICLDITQIVLNIYQIVGKGGYIFGSVCLFVCLSFCLSFC